MFDGHSLIRVHFAPRGGGFQRAFELLEGSWAWPLQRTRGDVRWFSCSRVRGLL